MKQEWLDALFAPSPLYEHFRSTARVGYEECLVGDAIERIAMNIVGETKFNLTVDPDSEWGIDLNRIVQREFTGAVQEAIREGLANDPQFQALVTKMRKRACTSIEEALE